MITNLLVWIVFGLIVGALARFVVPGDDPMGVIGTILLGVAGSFLGGLVGWLLFGGGDKFAPSGFLGALVGAVVVLLLYRRYARQVRS